MSRNSGECVTNRNNQREGPQNSHDHKGTAREQAPFKILYPLGANPTTQWLHRPRPIGGKESIKYGLIWIDECPYKERVKSVRPIESYKERVITHFLFGTMFPTIGNPGPSIGLDISVTPTVAPWTPMRSVILLDDKDWRHFMISDVLRTDHGL
jgi:hypothetical protein